MNAAVRTTGTRRSGLPTRFSRLRTACKSRFQLRLPRPLFFLGCKYRTKYDAWGRVLNVQDGSGNALAQSAIGNRYLFQGREYSWTTGIYYFRARWYDPVTGRWLSPDPIGISGGLNQYVFCANNPVMFVDPFGTCGQNSSGFWQLFGNALNNTATAMNQSMGQAIYSAVAGEWDDNRWSQISSGMWSTATPDDPRGTPYISTALGVSAGAAAIAAAAGSYEVATGFRTEVHGTHGWTTPHLQGIQGEPGVGPPAWGKTVWRWPAH